MKNALIQACRRDFVRRIPPEERDRWCLGLVANTGTDAGVVDRDSRSAERGMSLRVDSGVGSRDAPVDGQCLWVANVANAVNLGLAGPEEDDAGTMEKTN